MYAIDSSLAIASANYRRWGASCVDTTISDVKAAMRYLRRNARALALDPTWVAVWGTSAGGYAASMNALTCGDRTFGKGTMNECPNATVVYFSDEDLENRDADLVAIGCPAQQKPQPGARYNPITYAVAGHLIAPMRFEAGTADCTVSYLQSVRMSHTLDSLSYESTLVVYSGFPHGITRPPWMQRAVYGATLSWIKACH